VFSSCSCPLTRCFCVNVEPFPDAANASAEFPTFRTRPIHKLIKVVDFNNTDDDTQVTSVLFTATHPVTLAGLRWVHGIANLDSLNTLWHWALVVVPDGFTMNDISIAHEDDFYQPAENVLAFGVIRAGKESSSGSPNVFQLEGSIKTKRRLKVGDQLVFGLIMHDAGNNAAQRWDSLIQFFVMS